MKQFYRLLFVLMASMFSAQVAEISALDRKVNQELRKVAKLYPDKLQQSFEMKKIYTQKLEAYEAILRNIAAAEQAAFPATEKGANTAEVSAEADAEYQNGGINGFRKDFAKNFDTTVFSGTGRFKTVITFIVERDGTISNVRAEGDYKDFNTVAAISVYKIKGKFAPGSINGVPVRSRFRFPSTLNFE